MNQMVVGSIHRWNLLWAVMLIVTLLPIAALPVAAAPDLPLPTLQNTPQKLVDASDVRTYAINGNALYWGTHELCIAALLEQPARSAIAAAGDGTESLLRTPTYGGDIRLLYEREVNQIGGNCNAGVTFRSNMVADADFVYWVRPDGRLVKLSREANPGDEPTPLLQQVFSGYPAANELIGLAISGEYLYLNSTADGKSTISRIHAGLGTITTVASLNNVATRLTAKGNYVYWLAGGCAYRSRLSRTNWNTIALECGGVTAIAPEGEVTLCILGCSTTDYVFLGKGKQVIRHNNLNGSESVVYTSPSSNPDIRIEDIASNGTNIFLVEYRRIECNPQPCFSSYDQAIFRSGRFNDSNAGLIASATGFFSPTPVELRTAKVGASGEYIFWMANGGVVRLPADVAAIPVVNMRATGIEVTQTIQDLNNSVLLVRNKRTFARVFVASDGGPVEGVRATLRATWDGGSGGPISAISPGGWMLTVLPNPDREQIGQSFLFELPLDWTTRTNLRLYAELNPQELPPEPNYGDNDVQVGPLSFQASPRLEVKFYAWGYELNGTTYYPRDYEDIQQTFGWIRRAYPLATPAPSSADGVGLAPVLSYVFDSELGARVDRTAEECQELDEDDQSKCAGIYIRSLMKAWRDDAGDSRPYFGWTSTAAGFFTRGAAGGGVGSSPAATMCCGAGWDSDGAITDWYTGHELGHILGRPHPGKAADNPNTTATEGCGHQTSDTAYPYDGALIGPAGGSLLGFDFGWGNLPKRLYPRDIWADMMSYCPNQWISDYTYAGLFNTINGLQAAQLAAAPSQVSGDFLTVYGAILPSADSAILHRVRRQNSLGSAPMQIPGGYSLRLYNAQNQQIADHPFIPEDEEDTDDLLIAEALPFVAGARTLRVIRLSDNAILAEQAISAGAPLVSAVTVGGAPGPISGPIDLSWSASDPDGDDLRFDILYSADNGQSFTPVYLGVSGNTLALDRSQLGGSTQAQIRVIASDGVQTGQADSVVFTLETLPPRPLISAPADGTTVQWGNTVTFIGEAYDLQDGYLGGFRLVWRNQDGVIGVGPSFSVDDLPVGVNTISLEATNSAGQKASTSITVIVQDDLELAGPTLSAAPTQIGWQVAAGAGVQSRSLSIANLGGGSLNWQAASTAAWLSVSAASGNAPATITINGDPGGIPAGESRSAMITLSAVVGENTQQVQIPVTLSVGASYFSDSTPSPGNNRQLYLPMLWR